jgi:Transposase DDE domain
MDSHDRCIDHLHCGIVSCGQCIGSGHSLTGKVRGPTFRRNANRKDAICFSAYLYRARNLVERFFNKIRQCRRVATRYDKLAANYLAFIKLASNRIWLRANESTPWSSLSGTFRAAIDGSQPFPARFDAREPMAGDDRPHPPAGPRRWFLTFNLMVPARAPTTSTSVLQAQVHGSLED